MGTVWRAYDEVLHRPVAVKEVRLSLVPVGERAIVRERTLREARATAMLSHPNVVTLYDVVEVASEPYVVMELLPSRSLAAYIIERGTLTHVEAAEIGSAVASALITAHRAGITHRDVKPGNVLIGGPGQIKLTDFGIARNAAESSMTQTGTVLGSPPYIAPEVAMGRGVGPAADLWGLGATLFACIEGRPPYDGGDPVSTVSAVVHSEVPVPSGQGPVVDVIRGLMVKDPALRMPLPAVRRRLRPMLPRPEDAVVSPPPPGGRIAAPGPTGSDNSGLIPIPRTHPLPDAAEDAAPSSDPGPATAASPDALPETAEDPGPDDAREPGVEEVPDAAAPEGGDLGDGEVDDPAEQATEPDDEARRQEPDPDEPADDDAADADAEAEAEAEAEDDETPGEPATAEDPPDPDPDTDTDPDPDPDTGPSADPADPAGTEDSASATRVVPTPAAASASATTTVTPQVSTDGPTRRVPRSRLPRQVAPPPRTPAAPWPPPSPPTVPAASPAPGPPRPEPASVSQSLAADPGPLPFSTRAGAPEHGDRRITVAVAVLVVVLALLGAVGGYTLVRWLGDPSATGVVLVGVDQVVAGDVLVRTTRP